MITPLPGITTTKPGSATRPFPGIKAEIKTDKGDTHRGRRRRPARADAPVAGDAARHLRRSGALREAVLEPLDAGHLLHRRRRQARQGRLFLAARPRRRRAQRRRPSHRHDGSGERARRSPARRGSRGRRPAARDQGPGGRRVRHAQGRHAGDRGARSRAQGSRRARRSARSRGPTTSSSPRTCRRRARARSCAGCCAISPRERRSATPRRSPIRRSWRS